MSAIKIYLWERACSRMRWVSLQIRRLTLRLREEARFHRKKSARRLLSFTSSLAISDDAHRPCRQTPNRVFGHFSALLCCFSTGYSLNVADPFSDRAW
ncbi:hypothetical protein CXF97_08790 [Pseudomonas sp. Choline-02u-1]|nr:hypothetical protein CXF97_08790 [Pseudomonas sp. Choline-02u-1]